MDMDIDIAIGSARVQLTPELNLAGREVSPGGTVRDLVNAVGSACRALGTTEAAALVKYLETLYH